MMVTAVPSVLMLSSFVLDVVSMGVESGLLTDMLIISDGTKNVLSRVNLKCQIAVL